MDERAIRDTFGQPEGHSDDDTTAGESAAAR